MIPASQNFINAMERPVKELYLKIEIYDSKMNFISEITKKVSAKDIGTLSVDRTRPIRRSFSFTLDNASNEFTWGEDNLIWIDKRIKIYTGLKLPKTTCQMLIDRNVTCNDLKNKTCMELTADNSIEYIPQGVFILSEPTASHNKDGKKVTITGQDKAFLMTDKRGKFVNEQIIEKGAPISTAIKLIAQGAGETMFLFDDIDAIVPYELTYQPDDNRWKAIEELADFAKCDIYYDVNGYLRLQKYETDIDLEPVVWTYKYGDHSERFYAGNVRKMDETDLANHIRVLGGSGQTATVIYDLVVDDNDPLWKGSPYSIQKIGRILYNHNNGQPDSLITTKDEAKWRAKYELMNRLGYAEKVELSLAPNWLHDAGDVIQIEDKEDGVTGKYKINSFQLPLIPNMMSCECVKYRKVISDWNEI